MRELRIVGAQRGDNRLDAVVSEQRVNLRAMLFGDTRLRLLGEAMNGIRNLCGIGAVRQSGQRSTQFRPFCRRYVEIGKAGIDRVGAVHGLPGETEVSTDLARRARQQPGAADVGKETDTDFRHPHLGLVVDDTMAAVRRKPGAAAHHQPVHICNIGLREACDAVVENVFLAPEHRAEIALLARAVVKSANVTTGAQPALTRAFQHDQRDGRIGLKRIQRAVHVAGHFQRQRIDRLRTIETDHTGRALTTGDEIAFGCVGTHRTPSISLRDTINRMISLVPSRI